jgi:guanyl-specific ribonuclease Sa
MKTFSILALAVVLAVVFTLTSAQAQSQDTTTTDQYTTQSTDQTTTPATPDDSMTGQQDQNAVSTPDTYSDTDQFNANGTSNDPNWKFYDREANRLQEIENDSGGN